MTGVQEPAGAGTIPRANYLRPEILRAEIDALFRPAFEFVALAPELAQDGDYVCLDYADTAIVVQNFKGRLKAFENICTHRFNRIQPGERGNGALTCRYHGWRFDEGGCPVGAAARIERAGADAEADLRLPEYRVAQCGQFVFVSRAGTADLRAYLGDFYAVLEGLSPHVGREIHFGTLPHAANWKILVENVVDSAHCATVHRDTFVSFGFCRAPVEDVTLSGLHSSWHVPRVSTGRDGARRRAFAHLDDRSLVHESFHHIFIFPNLFIASTEGISFYVGQALPLAPDRTLLRTRYFEPAVTLSEKHRVRQDALNVQARDSSLDIIGEDRPILEAIQVGMERSSRPGALLKGEPRIGAFFDAYSRRMGREGEDRP